MFKKIVSVDNTGLIKEVRESLKEYSNEIIFYNDYPKDKEEVLNRVEDADCILVSWNTIIDEYIIKNCKNLKYIGMCCSLYDEKSANVDIIEAKKRGIKVLGVKDYGDEGVIEYILGELSALTHGFRRHKWKNESYELTGLKLGIIGMGTLGEMLGDMALKYGMEVFYYNRTIKEFNKPFKYLELEDLLKKVDIISTHLPKNTIVLSESEFNMLGEEKILVNTSLEPTFDILSFESWIKKKNNYAIFDKASMGLYYDKLKQIDKVIYTNQVAGWTEQAKARLSYKVLENLKTIKL